MKINKKEHIARIAMKLFYTQGINAVGVNEVISVAEVSKRTLYKHFASKELLILETLRVRDENFTSWFASLVENEKDGYDAIENIFLGLNNWFRSEVPALGEFRGCFFINTSSEFSETNSEIFKQCQRHKMKIRKIIKDQVAKLNITPAKYDYLTDIICVIKDGCITTALIQQDNDIALKGLEVCQQMVSLLKSD